jgi:hypothetical protein
MESMEKTAPTEAIGCILNAAQDGKTLDKTMETLSLSVRLRE